MQAVARPSNAVGFVPSAGVLAAGFFGVQFFLGYEWLMSGLAKLVSGDFASTLGATLADMTKDQSGPYKSFIDNVAIPNGQLFGTLVMAGELTAGAVFIVAALAAVAAWSRLGPRGQSLLLGVVGLTAIVGAFMSLNFHLAMGANAPWTIAPDPNDQGVDLDSLMVVLQLVFAGVAFGAIRQIRRNARS